MVINDSNHATPHGPVGMISQREYVRHMPINGPVFFRIKEFVVPTERGLLLTGQQIEVFPATADGELPTDVHDLTECSETGALITLRNSGLCSICGRRFAIWRLRPRWDIYGTRVGLCRCCEADVDTTPLGRLIAHIKEWLRK